jgi:hypothetical protein
VSERASQPSKMTDYATELLRRQLNGQLAENQKHLPIAPLRWTYDCSLTDLNRNPPEGVSVGLVDDSNIFNWELLIVGPPDTLYEGGFFKATLEFPRDFPNNPPTMTFVSEMWHPNGELEGYSCSDPAWPNPLTRWNS